MKINLCFYFNIYYSIFDCLYDEVYHDHFLFQTNIKYLKIEISEIF